MAIGLSATLANSLLDAYCNATSYSVATPYIKLYIGDPGAAGTANAAVETTRKLVSFGAAASGAIANDAQISWTSVAATEDYTHWGLWTASSGGTFLQSGTITANAVTIGDTFNINTGDLDITASVAS